MVKKEVGGATWCDAIYRSRAIHVLYATYTVTNNLNDNSDSHRFFILQRDIELSFALLPESCIYVPVL